ncbi:MAG: polymer-forming cytoskeletal protein [bacterium]
MGLFSGEKKSVHQAVDCIIGSKAKFKGELTSQGSVCINGQVEGKINVTSELIIAPGSSVVGEVKGETVTVSGKVEGNIVATNVLEITQSGRVHGDLIGGKIIIDEGSSYSGRVKVDAGSLPPEDKIEEPVLMAEEIVPEPQTAML